ncbi:transposase [Clostridium magnum]|uniref:Tc1-like transposase DDE domain-containing protein n=1 Tax=Clostridium magnum DSM 2767 TaxID=1121326 RepID=A0A162RIY0_9CLOT|nr:transposase [Clostridium magnum]KZL89974.1 hypothetical protein CLMAG_44580 [Clostridium magnum DSM 2767]KZL91767.1 hypothetical protein CLMAG_35260 [Clostridium magnum DSM 2767]SHJ63508.1 Transposase [Clostridium magnum DSM 2767]
MNRKLLKKTLETLDTLESSSEVVVYALDETKVCVESDNRLFWSPVGNPPVLEKNASHDGVNIIGSTSILNNFHTVNDLYSSEHSITSKEVKAHIENLIEINEGKKVVLFMDNAKFHTSYEMQSFFFDNKGKLTVILLPRYSPNMNPQENIWNYLKAKLFRPSSRSSIFELISDIKLLFDELNNDFDKIRSLAYARSFLV